MKIYKQIILKILLLIPDKIFNYFLFILKVGYIPSFKNPKSLNEYINNIKLYSSDSLRELVADRIKVRDYISNKRTSCFLINILWTGMNFDNKVYESMPNKFVIKANHGSGMVIIVDKNKTNFDELNKEIVKWQNLNYGKLTRQWFYSNIERSIIIEEYLEFDGGIPPDYKFFCINGKVELIQVDSDRSTIHTRNLYNKDFKKLDAKLLYESSSFNHNPILYKEAIIIAEKLSEDFNFIRVDLYILDTKIYFGELTNTPGNGFEPFVPRSLDYELGNKI